MLSFIKRCLRKLNSLRLGNPPENPQSESKSEKIYAPLGHYYSPTPSLEYIDKNKDGIFSLPASIPGVDLREGEQIALFRQLKPYYDDLPFPDSKSKKYRYYFENNSYSFLDGIFLHSMIRHFKPARIIEIGSGYTTALMKDTSDIYLQDSVDITCIEPYPDLVKSLLTENDLARIKLHDKDLQDVDLSIFSDLKENDILFIDSTHVGKVGSDVLMELFDILPMLSKGVLIHIHDVFYPFEYPYDWIYENRGWNELYMLRAFLQYNSDFEIVLFSSYLMNFHQDLIAELMPKCLKNAGGNIWLRRK